MVDKPEYPEKKSRELTDEEKKSIRKRILKLENEKIEGSVSQTLAEEFNCSPSQIAGIMAHMRM